VIGSSGVRDLAAAEAVVPYQQQDVRLVDLLR
jgi:hypothetical protein